MKKTRSVLRPLSDSLSVSNPPAFWPCVRSPVCSTNAGGVGCALMRAIDSASVAIAFGFAGPPKPTCVSLICAKLNVPSPLVC